MNTAMQILSNSMGVSQDEVADVIKGMIISSKNQHGATATNAELAIVSSVCAKYDLNPLVSECAAFVSGGKLSVVVMIQGWYRIVNRQPEFDGVEFEDNFDGSGAIVSTTCIMYLKNRSRPVKVTEYYAECKQDRSDVWKKYPLRMLRHKAYIQCAKMAFGLSEILDDDEAARITGSRQEKDITTASTAPSIDWQAINDMMAECADLDTLKGVAGGLRREMEINGTWAQHKDHMILLHAEHKERIEKAYNQPVELYGEVVDAEFTDVDFGNGE